MSRFVYLGVLFFGLASSACDDGDSGKKGGSCTTADQCWFVSSPTDYDVAFECKFTPGGVWSAEPCSTTGYTRKCTQPTDVDNKTVTYVYYWKDTAAYTCLDTEEAL